MNQPTNHLSTEHDQVRPSQHGRHVSDNQPYGQPQHLSVYKTASNQDLGRFSRNASQETLNPMKGLSSPLLGPRAMPTGSMVSLASSTRTRSPSIEPVANAYFEGDVSPLSSPSLTTTTSVASSPTTSPVSMIDSNLLQQTLQNPTVPTIRRPKPTPPAHKFLAINRSSSSLTESRKEPLNDVFVSLERTEGKPSEPVKATFRPQQYSRRISVTSDSSTNFQDSNSELGQTLSPDSTLGVTISSAFSDTSRLDPSSPSSSSSPRSLHIVLEEQNPFMDPPFSPPTTSTSPASPVFKPHDPYPEKAPLIKKYQHNRDEKRPEELASIDEEAYVKGKKEITRMDTDEEAPRMETDEEALRMETDEEASQMETDEVASQMETDEVASRMEADDEMEIDEDIIRKEEQAKEEAASKARREREEERRQKAIARREKEIRAKKEKAKKQARLQQTTEELREMQEKIQKLRDQLNQHDTKIEQKKKLNEKLREEEQYSIRKTYQLQDNLQRVRMQMEELSRDEGQRQKGSQMRKQFLRQLVSLVIVQERVLGRVKQFRDCEEVWKKEEIQGFEALKRELAELNLEKDMVWKTALQYAKKREEHSGALQDIRRDDAELQEMKRALESKREEILRNQQKQKADEVRVSEQLAKTIERTNIQRAKLAKVAENIAKERNDLMKEVAHWNHRARELGDRLEAIGKIKEIEGLLPRLRGEATVWEDVISLPYLILDFKMCKPFSSADAASPSRIRNFMRKIKLDEVNVPVPRPERMQFRIETRGRVGEGSFRSVFKLMHEDREYVGKIFHLRRGHAVDMNAAVRTVKSGILAGEAAKAYTVALRMALEEKGSDEEWSFEFISSWLLPDYDDPFPDSSSAPDGEPKRTVMMIEACLTANGNSFEKFTGSFGEFQRVPGMTDEFAPRGDISRVIDAFSHWTFSASDGRFMVVDLQGVYNEDTNHFLLTDPGIHSCGDLWDDLNHDCDGNCKKGGIQKYLSVHVCNKYCDYLGI